GVVWAGGFRTGRISQRITSPPASAICHAAPAPANPPPITQIGLVTGRSSPRCPFFHRLLVGTALMGAGHVFSLGLTVFNDTERTAFRARLLGRGIPTGKPASGILVTTVEFPSFLRTALDN